MEYWKYLKYLLRHKWYVAVECWKMGLYLHAFTHDLSKFRPSEWIHYARYFYGNYPNLDEIHGDRRNYISLFREDVERNFSRAWLHHQNRNKHHWQYWVLQEDEGDTKIIPIPPKIIRQMACDWIGASKAIRGKDAEPIEWYEKVKDKTIMNRISRKYFEKLIGYIPTPVEG